MGMLDSKRYLTGGDDPFAAAGDILRLHNARVAGTVTVGGSSRPEVKLLVSEDRDDAERVIVFTSGAAIVNQVQRMDDGDLTAMRNGGLRLKLGQKPTTKGNPMFLFVGPDDPTVVEAGAGETADDDIPF